MKRLVLFLFVLGAHINAAQPDDSSIILKLANEKTVKVNKAFTEENKILKNIIADFNPADPSKPEQLEKKKAEDQDEPIPVLNEHITQETIKQLQALTGKSEESVETTVKELDQKELAVTLLAADFLDNKHTNDLIKALTDKLLTQELTPEVSQLFEDLKMSNGISTVTSIHNESVRNNLVDALLKKGVPTNLMHTLQGHTSHIFSAVFSPDGLRIVTTSDDTTAKLWNAQTGELIYTLQGHTGTVYSAVFSSDGLRIVTASFDNTAKLWNAQTGNLIHTLQGHANVVHSAVFSPDGLRIVTASHDRTAKVWNAQTGELIHTLENHNYAFCSAVFSPDGLRIVIASDDKTAKVWNAQTGDLIHTLQGHTNTVNSAVFSPDGLRILTASVDNTAKVWNAHTGNLIHTLEGHTNIINSAAFSHDGLRIVTASWDNTAKLWDAHTGNLIYTFEGHTNSIFSAVFSPDGLRIVTASQDRTAKLWDAQTGELICTLETHTSGVKSAVFSHDDSRIVTASFDKTAKLWRLFLNSDYVKEYGWDLYDVPLAQVIKWVQTGKVEKAPKNIFKDLSTTFKLGIPSTYSQTPAHDAPTTTPTSPVVEEEVD